MSYFQPTAKERNKGKDRSAKVANADDLFGFELAGPNSIEVGSLVLYNYKAESSGFSSKDFLNFFKQGLYDKTPLVVVTELKRNKKGEPYFTGINANYFETKIDRGKVILYYRNNRLLPRRLYEKAIHAYRMDRVRGNVYVAKNAFADLDVLNTNPNWGRV